MKDFKKVLTDLQALDMRTQVAEKRILEKAQARFDEINTKLDEVRPRALLDSTAGVVYRQLIRERGQLAMIIARAQHSLAKS